MRSLFAIGPLLVGSAVAAMSWAHVHASARGPSDAKATPEEPRHAISVDGAPTRGAVLGRVTIVVFSDFSCSHCAALAATLRRVEQSFADDGVRVVWRDLPRHRDPATWLAAEAARAAAAQGRFWELHDLLFARRGMPTLAVAHDLARTAGLDLAQFDAALDEHRFRADIAADAAEGRKLGVTNTPTMFINGRRVVGARSFDDLAPIVREEAAYARAVEAEGVAREDLYDNIVGLDAPETTTYKVSITDAPLLGRSEATVTIALWEDVTAADAATDDALLRQILGPFSGDVRIAHKALPLHDRPEARLAAAALLAAARQDAFAALRERLLARAGSPITRGWLAAEARDLRLDVRRFATDLGSRAVQRHLDDEAAEANRLGILDGPAIYVDGKRLEELDRHALAALVAAERRHAQALAARVPRAQLYDELTRDGLTDALLDPDTGRPVALKDERGPERGASSAPITIVEFADFECYYCRAVEPTLKRVLHDYGDRVRLVYKHHPLSDDGEGERAAELAAAASLQGKFWPLHDQLLTADNLDDASLEDLARRASVDMGRLHATLDSGAARAIVRADAAAGDAVSGDDELATPTFVINGRMITGAQPYEVFKQQIDRALSRRQASR